MNFLGEEKSHGWLSQGGVPLGVCVHWKNEREGLNHLFIRREKEREKERKKERKRWLLGRISLRMWEEDSRESFKGFKCLFFPWPIYSSKIWPI